MKDDREILRLPQLKLPDLSGKSFFLATLGCFRNEYESDLVRTELLGWGIRETAAVEEADIIIINTCGFIAEACEESIDTILEITDLKKKGKNPPVLVIGCMAQRYRDEMLKELPELAGILGIGWKDCLLEAVQETMMGRCYSGGFSPEPYTEIPRGVDSSKTAALFVRIADGCERRCSFCVIPAIRGRFRSRRPESVLAEVERFCRESEKEVVLVAQDLTSYGADLSSGVALEELVRGIARIDGVRWIRLLYLQPEGITRSLLELIACEEKVCKYLDIPFQHASAAVLRRMNRAWSADDFLRLIDLVREIMPESALRTTVMTGFPGETEKDFQELLDFLKEVRFDWVGAFVFSKEEGTPAAALDGQVPAEVALERYGKILSLQEEIESEKVADLIGRELEVLLEEDSDIEGYDFRGRSYREAPEIDGSIYLKDTGVVGRPHRSGEFVNARIIGVEGLDPVGEI